MRHKSNRIHNEDWEPKDAVEEVTEGKVQHEHGGAVPEVRVIFLVSIFTYIFFCFVNLTILTESCRHKW